MSTSVSSVRVPGCRASAIRVTVPGKVRSGISGTWTTASTPGRQSERLVLRHIDLGADHVALHDGEHERAAGRIGLHQRADVDIALGDDAVERGDDALIGLLLPEHLEQRLLRRHIGLRNVDRGLPRLQGESIGVTLLRGHPAFIDQRAVAPPGHPCKLHIRLRLLHRCLELLQRRFRLGDLVVELRGDDLDQQLALLHVVADIDIALFDVAACASKDVGGRECGGGSRQADDHGAVARAHRSHAQSWHKIATLLCRGHGLLLLRIVAPAPKASPVTSTSKTLSPSSRPPRRRRLSWRCTGDTSVARAVTGACG